MTIRTKLASLALTLAAIAPSASAQNAAKQACINPDAVVSVDRLVRVVSKDKKDTTYVPMRNGQVQLTNFNGNGYENTVFIDNNTARAVISASHGFKIVPAPGIATQYGTLDNGRLIVDAASLYKNTKGNETDIPFTAEFMKERGMTVDNHQVLTEIPANWCRKVDGNAHIRFDRSGNGPSHDDVQDKRLSGVENQLTIFGEILRRFENDYVAKGSADSTQVAQIYKTLDSLRTVLGPMDAWDYRYKAIEILEKRIDAITGKKPAGSTAPATKPTATATTPATTAPLGTTDGFFAGGLGYQNETTTPGSFTDGGPGAFIVYAHRNDDGTTRYQLGASAFNRTRGGSAAAPADGSKLVTSIDGHVDTNKHGLYLGADAHLMLMVEKAYKTPDNSAQPFSNGTTTNRVGIDAGWTAHQTSEDQLALFARGQFDLSANTASSEKALGGIGAQYTHEGVSGRVFQARASGMRGGKEIDGMTYSLAGIDAKLFLPFSESSKWGVFGQGMYEHQGGTRSIDGYTLKAGLARR